MINWKFQFLRTLLFAPGNHPRKIAKAGSLGSNAIVLDLEDAVTKAEKENTREAVRAALPTYKGVVVIVRVNALATGLCQRDLETVICPQLHAIMLPKVEDFETLKKVDLQINALEKREGIDKSSTRLFPLIETARGLIRVREIAISAPPRAFSFIPEEEVIIARKIIQIFEKAEASGSASIQVEGKCVDYPIYQKTLQ